MSKKTTMINIVIVSIVIVAILFCCFPIIINKNQAKDLGMITNIENLSKVYDGKSVATPTYDTNNSDGKVSISFYSGNTQIVSPTDVGSYRVTISIAEGETVGAVSESENFVISKADPIYTLPGTLGIISGQTLENLDISQYNLTWQEPNTIVNEDSAYLATCIPTDTKNYNIITDIEVQVRTFSNTLTVPTLDKTFVYDGEVKEISLTDIENFDENTMNVVSQTLSATDTGTYEIVLSPKDSNTCWGNGIIGNLTLVWQIIPKQTFTISCSSNTDNHLITFNDNDEFTITFGEIIEETTYTLSGTLNGNIIIDCGENYNFILKLAGITITSYFEVPIYVVSAKSVEISVKDSTTNAIYDKREAVDEDETSASIYSTVDLSLKGKGSLTIVSDNNNGIHTKDDLEIKNLTLSVNCVDNALKGNDSVSITSGTLILISRQGDGIKTKNSHISSKGNQKGIVTISGGIVEIYAACDGIDASYNVEITGGTIKIYTDKYSEYSEEVSKVVDDIYYIRYNNDSYLFSVKYYNSDTDYVWKNAEVYSSEKSNSFNGSTYYYYKVDKPSGYEKMIVYMYYSNQKQSQDSSYYLCTSAKSINNNYDTLALSKSGNSLTVNFTNYTASNQNQPGGTQEGNTDKGDYSTKGIKADNEINITGGIIEIESYDDAIHTNNDVVLGDEDDLTDDFYGTGNISISGGTLTLFSNDDGIHADGILKISGGIISISGSYEGLEGLVVNIEEGDISVYSSDDGINGTGTTGESIIISGGQLYVFAGGDGIDSNSTTAYDGILIAGGKSVIISTGNSDSSIDTENGYKYTGGYILGLSSSGGMSSESTNCKQFSSNGKSKTATLSTNSYVVISDVVTIEVPKSMSALIICLSPNGTSISTTTTASNLTFDDNGVCWAV